jgi:hypothetical protein
MALAKKKILQNLSTFSFIMKQKNFILGKPYPHTTVAACLQTKDGTKMPLQISVKSKIW